jgi:hypothetical protein
VISALECVLARPCHPFLCDCADAFGGGFDEFDPDGGFRPGGHWRCNGERGFAQWLHHIRMVEMASAILDKYGGVPGYSSDNRVAIHVKNRSRDRSSAPRDERRHSRGRKQCRRKNYRNGCSARLTGAGYGDRKFAQRSVGTTLSPALRFARFVCVDQHLGGSSHG